LFRRPQPVVLKILGLFLFFSIFFFYTFRNKDISICFINVDKFAATAGVSYIFSSGLYFAILLIAQMQLSYTLGS